MQGMIVYALKRFIFLTGLIILMQNEADKRGVSTFAVFFSVPRPFCRLTRL